MLWTDAVPEVLALRHVDGDLGVASAVKVVSGAVYVSGYAFDQSVYPNPNYFGTACYWFDGVRFDLQGLSFDGPPNNLATRACARWPKRSTHSPRAIRRSRRPTIATRTPGGARNSGIANCSISPPTSSTGGRERLFVEYIEANSKKPASHRARQTVRHRLMSLSVCMDYAKRICRLLSHPTIRPCIGDSWAMSRYRNRAQVKCRNGTKNRRRDRNRLRR